MTELSADYRKGCIVGGVFGLASVLAGLAIAAMIDVQSWVVALGGILGPLAYDAWELRRLRRRPQ